MCFTRFFLLVLISSFFLSIKLLKCFEIKILDDAESALKTNKIHVSINLEELEAICKDNIIFSLDSPKIKIKNWEFESGLDTKNLRSFKNDKKVFISNFGVQLNLTFFNADQEALKKNLENSKLYISCLTIDNKGATTPKCFLKNLSLLVSNTSDKNFQKDMSPNEPKIIEFKENIYTTSYDLNISGTFKKVVNNIAKIKDSSFSSFLYSKVFLVAFFLLLLFSLYFFIPRKKEDVFFRSAVGIFLLSVGLVFLIKICLNKGYWPFDKIINPEQKSRVDKKIIKDCIYLH